MCFWNNLHQIRSRPKYNQNTTKTQPKYNQNTIKIQPKYNQNTTKTQPKYNQNTTKTQENYIKVSGNKYTKRHNKYIQNCVKLRIPEKDLP